MDVLFERGGYERAIRQLLARGCALYYGVFIS